MKNKQKLERGEPANRKNTGITILPELHQELQRIAIAENRTTSRVIEILLEWAVDQAKENNLATHQLKSLSIRPLRRQTGK